MRTLVPTFLFSTVLGVSNASAHGAHLGDLAGHSHWVGWAAAAAVSAWAVKRGSKAKDANNEEPDETEAGEQPEAAGA